MTCFIVIDRLYPSPVCVRKLLYMGSRGFIRAKWSHRILQTS